MSAEERVVVKTSVPKYQKEAWIQHADELDMSQTEFVATMTQAGIREFELESQENPSPDADPRGNALREPLVDILTDDEYREFDDIVDSLTEEFEELVDETLQTLAAAGLVEFSGRRGFRLAGGADGDD